LSKQEAIKTAWIPRWIRAVFFVGGREDEGVRGKDSADPEGGLVWEVVVPSVFLVEDALEEET